MLGDFEMIPAAEKQAAGQYKVIYQSVAGYRNQIHTIKNQLRGNSYSDVKSVLQTIEEDQKQQVDSLKTLEEALYDIVRYYENAEKTIIGEKVGLWQSICDAFASDFDETFLTDLLSSLLESGGNLFVKIGGEINVLTALAASTGENAFILVNPSVAQTTSKIIKGGSWVATGAKYGFPIIGAVIDFGSQLMSGEDIKDAAVKTGGHALIGAVVGGIVGSVIPGPGTVAGAAAGVAISTAITMAASTAFDYVYDNWDDISDSISEGWNSFTDMVGNAADNIGDAFCGFADNLGTIFG